MAKLAKLDVLFTGEPEKPRTWKGHTNARIEALTFDKTKIDGVELAATFAPRKGGGHRRECGRRPELPWC